MAIIPNRTKRILQDGGLAVGIGIRAFQSIEAGMFAHAAGFDFIFIDREHGAIDMSRAGEICTAALGQGVTPLVRTPGIDPVHYAPLFDCGAQGIVVPHIETADEARAVVHGQKYPPFGGRSMSRSSALTGYETIPISEIMSVGNAETMAVALVESRLGVENIEQIVAVEGLDAVLIGASDLCIDFGRPGKFDDPSVLSACERIISACAAVGVPSGIAGVREGDLLKRFIGLGVRLVHAGTDAPILIEAFRSRSQTIRQMWAEIS